MSGNEPTPVTVWVHNPGLEKLKFRCTTATMVFEIMDLIETAFEGAIKPYQQRLSLSHVLVADGIDNDEDLARSLGELGLRGDQCNFALIVRPKRGLESSGEEQVEREEKEEDAASDGSIDPSDVEIILDRPESGYAKPRARPRGPQSRPHRHIRQRMEEKKRRAEEKASRGSGSDVEMAEAR